MARKQRSPEAHPVAASLQRAGVAAISIAPGTSRPTGFRWRLVLPNPSFARALDGFGNTSRHRKPVGRDVPGAIEIAATPARWRLAATGCASGDRCFLAMEKHQLINPGGHETRD